jgi:hypothetical protein
MHVEAMAALVPLSGPQVRDRLPAKLKPEAPEKHRHISAKSPRVVTALTAIRQRPETVQAVRRAVSTGLASRTTSGLG